MKKYVLTINMLVKIGRWYRGWYEDDCSETFDKFLERRLKKYEVKS